MARASSRSTVGDEVDPSVGGAGMTNRGDAMKSLCVVPRGALRSASMSIPAAADAPPEACLNCGETWGTSHPRFCPACGQETNVKPPRIGEFLQQFGGAYFSTEGAMWRTLKLLLFKPGELTRQYLSGRRKHYVLPLRLYLSISVITLLAVRLFAGAGVDVRFANADGFDPKRASHFAVDIGVGRFGMNGGQFFCERLPSLLCTRLRSRIDLDAAGFQREAEKIGERFISNLGASMFVILPSLALWLTAVFRNRRMRYTEHLVFALHLHSFWFIALALALPGVGWLSAIGFLTMPVYTWLAFRRVYGGRWWPRLLRLALIGVLYAMTLALAMAVIGLWSLLT